MCVAKYYNLPLCMVRHEIPYPCRKTTNALTNPQVPSMAVRMNFGNFNIFKKKRGYLAVKIILIKLAFIELTLLSIKVTLAMRLRSSARVSLCKARFDISQQTDGLR